MDGWQDYGGGRNRNWKLESGDWTLEIVEELISLQFQFPISNLHSPIRRRRRGLVQPGVSRWRDLLQGKQLCHGRLGVTRLVCHPHVLAVEHVAA